MHLFALLLLSLPGTPSGLWHPDAKFAGMYGYERYDNPSCVKSWTCYVINVANCPVMWLSTVIPTWAVLCGLANARKCQLEDFCEKERYESYQSNGCSQQTPSARFGKEKRCL
jgi:hypothetical protein